jgi:hypothetical protein
LNRTQSNPIQSKSISCVSWNSRSMFGGLDLKGKEEKEANGGTAPSGASASAFGFMSMPAAAEPDPSSFSFLGAMGGTAAAAAPSEDVHVPTSGFNFMAPTLAIPPPPATPEQDPRKSSFSFVAAEPPSPTPTYAAPSRSYAAPVAGAGVTFGSAGTTNVIKRRTRGIKVGGGRGAGAASEMTPPAATFMPKPPQVTTHSMTLGNAPTPGLTAPPRPPSAPSASARNDAEQAARRAEQFMATIQQQSAITPAAPTAAAGMKSPGSRFAPPVDIELETAKKAAEAAQARLAKEKAASTTTTASSFKWFGGGWGGAPKPGDADMDGRVQDMARELGGVMVADPTLLPPSSASYPTPADVIPAIADTNEPPPKEESPMDRILREQEQIKLAMAQRHAAMQQQEEQVNQYGFVPDMSARHRHQPPQPQPSMAFELPQPPPLKLTPKEQLDIVFAKFQSNVKKAMDGVGRLRQQRNMLLDERYVALAKERLAIQQIAQAEAQQMAAAEADDFESAERLQIIMDGHHRDKGELTAILESIGRALTQLDSQTPDVVGSVAACFGNMEDELRAFLAEQSTADKEDGAEALKRFEAVARQLSAEDERIKQESKHIERDEQLASEERKELDLTILDQTGEMEENKAEAIKKLEYVQQEIIFLRKQLAEKESDVVRLQNEVAFQEQVISKVHVQFTRQFQRVHQKVSTAEQNRREWLNDKAAYERLRDAHVAEVKAHSESLLTHTNLMDRLKKEISLAGTFQDIVAKEIGFDNNRNEKKEADGEMAGLQADVVKCEAAVSEAKQLVKVVESTLIGLDHELKTLQTRLPALEAAKKDAASARDFKTAGQLSKEIKEATLRLQTVEQELSGDAEERKKEALAKLEKATKELVAMKAIADQQEEEAGKEIMAKIAEKIRKLVDTKNKVCGADDGTSVRGMGAFVLKGQIHALKIEGQHYGSKFGGWDEIMAQIDESDPEPAPANQEEPAVKEEPRSKEEKPSRPSDTVDPELVAKGKVISKKIKDAEEALEAAVTREDYEEAAELDELFKQIHAELECLGLTEAETEIVLSNDEAAAAVTPTAEAPTADEPEKVAETAAGAPTANEPEEVEETPAEAPTTNEAEKVEETTAENEAPSAEEETAEAPTEKEEEEAPIEENGEATKERTTDAEGDEFHDAVAASEETENHV